MGGFTDMELAGILLDVVPSAMKLIRNELRQAASDDLTVPQLRILAHVFGGIGTASGLAALQGVSLPAISKMADALVSRGLLKRAFKEGNRKQIFLELTAQGKSKYLKYRLKTQKILSLRMEKSNQRQKTELHRGLLALQAILKGKS